MAEKIAYKAYLSQFGKIETDAKNRIKAYLEEQIKQDEALKALYRAEKIDDCYNFIKAVVKASGCGQSATIEDAIVFKMARDYYLDILPKQADEPTTVKANGAETAESAETEAETELETKEEKPADNENSVVTDEYGFEIFGEEPEASAETAASAETKAEPENEKPADAPKYDEDGNGLLFDF